MRTMAIALRRGGLVSVAMIVAVLAMATSASAVWTPGAPRAGTGAATELIMRGTGPGQGVTGFIAQTNNPFNPLNGYPATNPTTGFDVLNEGFAGIITASPPSGAPTLQMYCIDIRTLTQGGYGYTLGDWDAANVPLVGYIGRILNSYYPTTDRSCVPHRRQPEGRGGAGGDLVLQRQVRAEHEQSVARHRRRHRRPGHRRRPAGVAAPADA